MKAPSNRRPMLTDVEVFAVRAVGLPDHLRAKLYPELPTAHDQIIEVLQHSETMNQTEESE